jgi:hypothetical protein
MGEGRRLTVITGDRKTRERRAGRRRALDQNEQITCWVVPFQGAVGEARRLDPHVFLTVPQEGLGHGFVPLGLPRDSSHLPPASAGCAIRGKAAIDSNARAPGCARLRAWPPSPGRRVSAESASLMLGSSPPGNRSRVFQTVG